MRVSVLAVLKTVILTAILVAVGVVGYTAYSRLPVILEELSGARSSESAAEGQEVIVTVPKGASLSQVGTILQQKGIISSRLVFKLVALIRGEQRKIKAGDYALKTGSDAGNVLDLLISGKTYMFPITIPEGYTIFQIADLFERLGISSKDDFLALAQNKALLKEFGIQGSSLEGYLFPDTYFLRPSEKDKPETVIRRMVQRFREVYDRDVEPVAAKHGWTTAQVVTLASLIEKEARTSEHALVSAVFHNRLRLNMRLQSDPTVIYGIKPMGSKITRQDLDRKQPYNTYQVAGLPPGPIANPGRASLIASVHPADKDYLYFVARNDGTHEFSSNLKEHNKAVDLFQRNARSRNK